MGRGGVSSDARRAFRGTVMSGRVDLARLRDLAPRAGGWRRIARVVDSRGAGVALVLAFLFVSSAWVFNLNSRSVNRTQEDEWHTLVLGTRHLSPFGDPVPTARVGETNRWFTRLLYPLGIWYMNGRMGGELGFREAGGFDYAGGYYLRDHLTGVGAIQRDPNVQDY